MIRPPLLALFIGSVAFGSGALYEWEFDDPTGTVIGNAANSGSRAGSWEPSLTDTFTTGDGFLSVRRTPDGPANAYIPLLKDLPDKVWVLVTLEGWNFGGSSARETLRIGLADQTHEMSPHVFAQIRFERVDANAVAVAAEGFGDLSESTPDLPLFPADQTEPVTFVLEMDRENESFVLHYRAGTGPFLFLGEGRISPTRQPNFLRFGVTGHLGASGEELRIDRIALLDENPLTTD